MRKSLAGTLRAGRRVKQAQIGIRGLSSAVVLGTKYRLFFPTNGVDDVIIAQLPGRKFDYDATGIAFCPLPEDAFTTNASGKVRETSVLRDWDKILKVIHQADCDKEKADAEREAARIADEGGEPIDTIALNQKLHEIELSYFGDNNAKPQKIYATKKPVMEYAKPLMATEAWLVPLGDNGEPKFEVAERVSVPLESNKRIDSLFNLLDNKDYFSEGEEFLEVGYDYVGASKKEAGQNATFYGIAKDLKLENKYSDLWKANAKEGLERIAKTSEEVMDANMSMSASTTIEECVDTLKKYVSKKRATLLHINVESDDTKAAAKFMLDNNLCEKVPNIARKLLEIVESTVNPDAADESEGMDLTKEEFEAVNRAESLKDLAGAVDDKGKLGISEDEMLEELDLA